MRFPEDIRMRATGTNVPDAERAASVIAGVTATALGARRGGLLGWLIGAGGVALTARGVSGRCPVYRTRALGSGVMARRSITIQAPRSEIYRVWRQLETLPTFLEHVTEVVELDDERSRWTTVEGPMKLTWEARISEDVPDQRIAWQSVAGADVDHAGSVELVDAPGGRGTEVIVTMHYRPPGGVLVGAPLRGLLRRFTRRQLDVELRRLRQLVETGEIATGAANRAMLTAHDARTNAVLGEPQQVALPRLEPEPTRTVQERRP